MPKTSRNLPPPKDDSMPDESGRVIIPQPEELSQEEALAAVQDSFSLRLAEWIQQSNPEGLEATVTLYKFDNPNTGEGKSLYGQWKNEIPDQNTIGMTYGSGRYLILVWVPGNDKQKKTVRGYRFKIGSVYDDLRKQGSTSSMPAGLVSSPLALASVHSSPNFDSMMSVFQKFMEMIRPMQQPSGNGNFPDMMAQMYSSVNKILQHNMIENTKFLAAFQRQMAGIMDNSPADVPDDDPENETGVMDKIVSIAEKVIPLLGLKSDAGSMAGKAVDFVKLVPEIQKVLSSPDDLKKIIAQMDSSLGKEKTDEILKGMKVKRP